MKDLPGEEVERLHEIARASRANRRKFAAVGAFGAVACLIAGAVMRAPIHGVAAAGLSSDIAGALLLVTGLMLPDWLVTEMGTARWGSNPFVHEYWLQARRDAGWAATLLVIGFFLQAMSAALA